MTLSELLNQIKPDQIIIIDAESYTIKSKTKYTTTEDPNTSYYKCILDDHQALVILPNGLIYLGSIIPNLDYQRISDTKIQYDNQIFQYTGAGHQIVVKVDFGIPEDVEGECDFEDYESDTHIISLGVLKNGERADVYARKINLANIKFSGE